MARTQAQREAELLQRKQQIAKDLAEAEARLVAGEKSLRSKYFPSEEKFKPWALAARAADANRPLTPKEFIKDFYKEFMQLVKENKTQLAMGDEVIKEWETWFNGIDAEDLSELEAQMDAMSLPLNAIQAS